MNRQARGGGNSNRRWAGILIVADQRYQVMLAARQQDPEALRRQYESVDEIVLSIDGLQPEKGHETLYTTNLESLVF